MPRKLKQIRFEEGNDEDWSGSSSNSSRSSVASFHRESYPKKGTTRIPARLVSKRALIDLGYPFVEEGATIVLLQALDQRLIDEVLGLSKRYRRLDAEIDGGRIRGEPANHNKERSFDWVNVEIPDEDGPTQKSVYDENDEDDEPSGDDLDSTFGDTGHDEREGPIVYSGVLSLNTTKVFGENTVDLTAGRFPSWIQEKSDLINGTTHLHSVHAAEFYMDRAGNQRITLVCPNDPGNGMSSPSSVRMRWLHLQAQSLNLTTLENLVADCPYISHPLKLVALTVLKEVTVRCTRPSETGLYIEPGSTVQYIGRYNRSLGSYPGDEISDTEPVVLLSAPHLVLAEKSSRKRHNGNHYTRSLLEVLYGYDNVTSENARILQSGSQDLATLQVPQLWSLIIGADLIITCSELSSREIHNDLITIDGIISETGVYTIRLIDERDTIRYHIVIKPDCKYVDFLRHAVSLVSKGQSNATAYDLVDDSGFVITADVWLRLLADGSIEDYVFCLRPRHAALRTPDEDFRALSARLTAGSRSSLGRFSRRSSFRSELGSSNHNMQMVVHPSMWEYGAGSEPPYSRDSADNEGSDMDIETSTMSFGSHLNEANYEDSSIDGIVDLTSSASETSIGMRRSHKIGSTRSLDNNYVPELFDMDRHTEFRRGQITMYEISDLQVEQANTGDRPDKRFVLRRRETARSARSGETDPETLPRTARQQFTDGRWNPSRASTFTYSHGPPLSRETLSSSFDPPETPGSASTRASSYRNPGFGPTLDAFLNSDFEAGLPPLNTPDLDFVPFLAWRLTWKDDQRSTAEIDRTLFQLLTNLNTGLESDGIGKWYRSAFECTQAQLLERFQCLVRGISAFPEPPEGSQEAGVTTANSTADDHFDINATVTPELGSLRPVQRSTETSGDNDTSESLPPRESTLFGSTVVDTADGLLDGDGESFHHLDANLAKGVKHDNSRKSHNPCCKTFDEFLLQSVLDVSREVFGAFLPREGSFVTHTMCKRFWGSVDTILRQIRWSLDVRDVTERESWIVIRPPRSLAQDAEPHSPGNDLSPDCHDCQRSKRYECAEDALNHWHNHHMYTPCPNSMKRGRPFDDPCAVLLCRPNGTETRTNRRDRIQHEIVSSAEAFFGEVQNIVDQTEELHKLVCSVTASADPINSHNCRPHLTSSLVNAFEGILSMFVLKAKELSWMNRFVTKSGSSYSRNAERRLDRLKEAGGMTSRRVREHLVMAKEDIIMLGTTKEDSERIIIAPIGPEFLAACLISSLQNNVLVAGTERKLDLIADYRNRTSRLWFNTNRRPKRRAFVEIHALEEELEALRIVVTSQQDLLRSYQRLLSPSSFRLRTTDRLYYKERKASFNLENKCIHRQQRRLAERDKALSILQRKARTLRDETKQRIEILDEGHGKAIRVFTIVTLFFLPLSFVTSFFGMNTTDIRDMSRDQKVFWVSALPVTFGVLGLAFLYGYKWDMILAWASKAFKSPDTSATLYGPRNNEQPTWATAAEHRDSELPVHYKRPSPAGWRNKSPFLFRQKSRAKTDDSLFRP